LSNEAIARLPIPQVTRPDAYLFMWSTGVMLEHAIAIMRGWGLPYKTHAVWDKLYGLGHGYYFRMCHEVLLLGLAPDAPHHFEDSSIESMLRVKATRQQHSRKPTMVHDIVRRACGNGPFLKLFARKHVPGWDCFGNQLAPRDDDDQLAADWGRA
jgi:N6-adenosine-specific RNA methylase IME4